MAKYMIDEVQVNTSNAKRVWEENTFFDGNNRVSCATLSEWNHETLYLSRKDRYYIVHSSQWQGSVDRAEFVTAAEAATWLLQNNYDENQMPEDLKKLAAAQSE